MNEALCLSEGGCVSGREFLGEKQSILWHSYGNVLRMGYAMKPAVVIKKGCSDDE
ncbi:hypothetical protein G3823_000962 [Escherichia coli]|nr:hypothetical protein [Escherichia coli]EFU2702280.1 hypothetical protein [Escherichia coli]EGB0945869.1 hypothetical protein [Escherichia coli]